MASSATQSHVSGNGVVPAEVQRDAGFFKKFLHVRDEVFAGTHARIHLPPKVREQVAPRPRQTAIPPKPATNGIPNGSLPLHSLPPRPAANAPRTFSGIDPVLLTKSDHLIRAELKLKRQQLERALKDQFDRKGRGYDDDREALDVESLLAEAQRLVKPVSGLHVSASNSDAAESFDENSYYSSKANSWSSDEADHNQNSNADAAPLTPQGKHSAAGVQLIAPKPKHVEPTVIDLDEEPYEPADDIEHYEPEAVDLLEAEESDYSPPPAELGLGESGRGRGREHDGIVLGYDGDKFLFSFAWVFERQKMGGCRCGHPSSRLAWALSSQRYIQFRRVGSADQSSSHSRNQSPAGFVPPIQNSRKRKLADKREERRDEKRRQQASKQGIRSPEPYIKEEPQSPPPFTGFSEPQPPKRRALVPPHDNINFLPIQDGDRAHPIDFGEPDLVTRSPRHYEELASPGFGRVSQRRLEPDHQDLRRVASLQHARRPYTPVGADVLVAPEPRHIRAASHAFPERPTERIGYRDVSARPSGGPRYLRERSHSPPIEYLPRVQSPMSMPPPPHHIVVDQYGNKYYASPVDALEPPSRRIEVDSYYEPTVMREPAMRAPGGRIELHEDDDLHRMPPPPPRRYLEAPDVDTMGGRPYRRESSHRAVEVRYRPQNLVERRPVVQYEEMGPPRDYVPARAYSVRPETVRREAPEAYTRHESMQPGHVRAPAPHYREVSVIHQDPYDDRNYAFAAPQSRGYAGEGVVERPLDEEHDAYSVAEARRAAYRY